MSDSTFRINTKVGNEDQVIKVNLKQGIKAINILSLEINPEDAYDVQTSEYGVIVGRVLANKEFGIPNVKVSVFIPIDETDENNYIIANEYPYKTPQSKNINGVKYNLVRQGADSPGTFPNKNFVLDNDSAIEVFDKYWKYTTTTNESGDYMIFGVPTGTCQVHYDCDLSDIGILSQHPYDLIEKGYDANLFKYRTKFSEEDLSSAVHIISQDSTVYVYPFWGDKGANKIGITRKDFDVNYEFTPSCIFMGSSITDAKGSYIGVDGRPNGSNGYFSTLETSTGNIEMIRYRTDGTIEEVKENVTGIIDGNGVWCYQIPMNLDRIGTDEYGNLKPVGDPTRGIPTRARVRFRITLTDTQNTEASEYTAKMLVPCNPKLEHGVASGDLYEPIIEGFKQNDPFNEPSDWKNIYEFGSNTPDSCFRDLYWGKVYSVKQYYPRFQYEYEPKNVILNNSTEFLSPYDEYRDFPPHFSFNHSCISSIDNVSGLNLFPYTTLYSGLESIVNFLPSAMYSIVSETNKILRKEDAIKNIASRYSSLLADDVVDKSLVGRGFHFCFENDWLNGCLYFPRIIIKRDVNGAYYYFGSLNDEHENDKQRYNQLYEHTMISGRHHWLYSGGTFSLKDFGVGQVNPYDYPLNGSDIFDAANAINFSVFSRSNLNIGIAKRVENRLNQSVFYYRCGGIQHEDGVKPYVNGYVYRRLYSTDLILLGNVEDIFDTFPKIYESLSPTTAILPPLNPPLELSESGMCELSTRQQITLKANYDDFLNSEPIYKKYYDIYTNDSQNLTYSGETVSGYTSEYGRSLYNLIREIIQKKTESAKENYGPCFVITVSRRYSLFFHTYLHNDTSFIYYDTPTFVNSSRLCELDVHNDSFNKVKLNGTDFVVPINGVIDKLDISTNTNRSAFASMNFDINKYWVNEIGHRQYAATPLAITGFEGRLHSFINKNNFSILDKYNNPVRKLAVDDADNSYICFRFGKKGNKTESDVEWRGPFAQSPKYLGTDNLINRGNGNLLLPENSFYFYFGLRTGLSAIDVLRSKYIDSEPSIEDVIVVSQDSGKNTCKDGEQMGTVNITTYGLPTPIDYELYFKNLSVINDTSDTSSWDIEDLPLGVYRIDVTDAYNRSYSKYFSVLSSGAVLETQTRGYDNENILTLQKINNETITSLSAVTDTELIIVTPNTSASITFLDSFKSIEEGARVHFDKTITSVDATISMMTGCGPRKFTSEYSSGPAGNSGYTEGFIEVDNTFSGVTTSDSVYSGRTFSGTIQSNHFTGITQEGYKFNGIMTSDNSFSGMTIEIIPPIIFSGTTETCCIKSYQTFIF